MKKSILFVSTLLLFAGLTFGQTPQTQDKTKTTTKTEAKTETKSDAKKDSKAGCEKTCTMKKSSCCEHKGEMNKESKAPEKK